jgi:hypothetical protein
VVHQNYTVATPDPSLRTCKGRPQPRALDSDKAVSTLLADAFDYGDDCSSKLSSTWKSIDDAKARADTLNAQQQAQPK